MDVCIFLLHISFIGGLWSALRGFNQKKPINECSSDDLLPLQVVFAQGFKVFFLEEGDARVRRKST